MNQRILVLAAVALSGAASLAQSNTVQGLDGMLFDISEPTVWGREGAAWPNGRLGFSVSNTMCNPGSVLIPWAQAMAENHPKFGFMVTRITDDRMVQISDRSFVKHAFLSVNGGGGPCAPCQNPNNNQVMGIGCSDAYAASNNGDRFWLGPAGEIDPWLGTWNRVGSYFDQGDPNVGPPNNMDGQRSLTMTMTSEPVMGPVKNRVTIREQDVVVPNSQFYYMVHLIHEGEGVAARNNNILSRRVTWNWNGSSWSASNSGGVVSGTVLNRWTGAGVSLGGNGTADGRIAVAVKVTGPNDGLWHYEYAVHNIDNSRGAAGFRIPVCTAARVQNIGFRDIDADPLNEWTAQRSGGELVFAAPAGNPLDWNMLFNFWFDSDAAPVAGNVAFDQARTGPGALGFQVAADVPGSVPNLHLGDGCGTPAVTLGANGAATIPNPGFAMQVRTAPFTGLLFFYSLGGANVPLGNGCAQYLDLAAGFGTGGFLLTDTTGAVTVPLPIPAGVAPIDLYFQAASLANGGLVFGSFNLSNGLGVRVGATGCP